MNKKVWVVILIVIVGAYLVGLKHSNQLPGPGNVTNSPIIGNQSPTPTISLALKQQCYNDANTTSNRLNQESAGMQQQAQTDGQSVQYTYSLESSAYSKELNTCVADILYYGYTNNKKQRGFRIYDTTSGKLLAQEVDQDCFNNFIPGKVDMNFDAKNKGTTMPCVVSGQDVENYRFSLGL